MATTKSAAAQQSEPQSIEQLQQRYQELHKQQIQAATSLEHAKDQLEALRKEAREKYGSDDLSTLQEKLRAMREENESKRRKYQADLDAIQTALAAVDAQFADTETPGTEDESC